MIVTRFSDVDEFLGELDLDASQNMVQRGIVRLTNLHRPSQQPASVRMLIVLCAYVTHETPTGATTLVKLERHIGDLWGASPNDEEVFARAETAHAQIEACVAGLNARIHAKLELRAGMFEHKPVAA